MFRAIFCILIVFNCYLNAAAQSPLLEQRISLQVKQKSLSEILSQIESLSQVKFNYTDKVMPKGLYSVKFKNEALSIVLTQILQKHALTYALMYGQSIVILPLSKSDKRYTVSGYVTDDNTGEKLIGVTVLSRNGQQSTLSNQDGFYTLSLPADSVHLSFNLSAYKTQYASVFLTQNTALNIALKDDYTEYKYTYSYQLEPQSKLKTEGYHLSAKTLKQLPVLFGESDLMKGIQLLAGVNAGSDGTIGANVRGGSADQNLILLDDVPLYNPSHIYGFFSVFNSDVVKDVKLIKGGMNARYAGRLSSVIDVRSIDGNKKAIKAQLSLGLIASKLTIDGPIGKQKKTTFVASARRSYIDILRKGLSEIPTGTDINPFKSGYYFYDINAKIKHDFSHKHQLSLSYYLGQDIVFVKNNFTIKNDPFTIRQKDRQDVHWGNQLIALRDHHVINSRLSGLFSVANTTYRFGNQTSFDYSKTSDTSVIKIGSASYNNTYVNSLISQYHLEYALSPNSKLTSGINYTNHWFRNSNNYQDSINLKTISQSKNVFAHEFSAYMAFNTVVRQKLFVDAGCVAIQFFSEQQPYNSLQPRLNVQYKPFRKMTLHTAYQSTAQFLHMVSSNSIGLPIDVWLPSNKSLAPETSRQISGGFMLQFPKYSISIDAFNKRMNHLIELVSVGKQAIDISNEANQFSIGSGLAYGYECMIEKKAGKLNGWMSYTLSWNHRQFEGINQGQVFPYRYDRRHNLACLLNYVPNKKIEASAAWAMSSGARFTIPEQVYTVQNGNQQWEQIYLYSDRNNYQFPLYHRLDLTVTFKQYHAKYTSLLSIGAYNIYNQFNPFYIQSSINAQGNNMFEAVSLFPCIPSVFYKIQF